jgi:hypothetical protein
MKFLKSISRGLPLPVLAISIVLCSALCFALHQPAAGVVMLVCAPASLRLGGSPLLGDRLRDLSLNPTLINFAQDASQAAIRKIANFLAPSVEVPAMTGQYKIFDAKHRYKRPITRRSNDGRATRVGFVAGDAFFNLEPNALDFPIPNVETMDEGALLNYAKYGATLLSDAAGLSHEGETIDKALAAVGAGTDYNFTSATVYPLDLIDAAILAVKKLAKNGAGVKVLFGTTAFLRTRQNKDTRARFVGGRGGAASGGASVVSPQLADLSNMLFSNPTVEMSDMVEDKAAEGLAEDIQFMLDTAILVFASNEVPNTMDPSFMKTFRLMGQWMTPGAYESEDRRDNILKMDWHEQLVVTNSIAAIRLNANAA